MKFGNAKKTIKHCWILQVDFIWLITGPKLQFMWDDGGPHEIPSRVACGPRAAGWTALVYGLPANALTRTRNPNLSGNWAAEQRRETVRWATRTGSQTDQISGLVLCSPSHAFTCIQRETTCGMTWCAQLISASSAKTVPATFWKIINVTISYLSKSHTCHITSFALGLQHVLKMSSCSKR